MEGPSTVFWVAVAAWTVVISPSTIPKLSFKTFVIGAKQLVVHDALEKIFWSAFNSVLLTPITYIGVWSLDGADNTTFLAPASRCLPAVSSVKKKPVDSIT